MRHFILGIVAMIIVGLALYAYMKYEQQKNIYFMENCAEFAFPKFYTPSIPVQERTGPCIFQ